MITTIARHELFILFKTGKIWKFLALCQLFLGLVFWRLMQDFLENGQQTLLENRLPIGITEKVIHPLFAWTTLFFLFITPLLATHTITQQRKLHIFDLYFTSAIRHRDIILGKFLGILTAQTFLLLPTLVMPLIIAYQDHLDLGQFFSGIFGLILIQTATLSLAFYIASLCKEPLVATLMILITLFLLSLLEWGAYFLTPSMTWITELALLYHCQNFFSGIINTKDILYYTLISITFLYFSTLRLEREAMTKRYE